MTDGYTDYDASGKKIGHSDENLFSSVIEGFGADLLS